MELKKVILGLLISLLSLGGINLFFKFKFAIACGNEDYDSKVKIRKILAILAIPTKIIILVTVVAIAWFFIAK